MNVFLNGAKAPSLKIGNLEGDSLDGGLALQGPGIFANLTVTPGATEGLAKAAEKDPTAAIADLCATGKLRHPRNYRLMTSRHWRTYPYHGNRCRLNVAD